MRMIQKITPIIFLFSTVFGSESALYQAIASCKNLVTKRPEMISVIIGTIGGGLVRIAEQIADGKSRSALWIIYMPIGCAYSVVAASLLIESSLVGTAGSAIFALPVFFMSWFGTNQIINKLD
jgi:hypothetical protein